MTSSDPPVAHCWTSRYEADGFKADYTWLVAQIDAGRYNDGWETTPEWRDRTEADPWAHPGWDDANATCMLPANHDGPHEFTPETAIVVVFRNADGTWPPSLIPSTTKGGI